MEIRVVRTIEAIEALQPEWDALFAGCEHADIFVSHGWMLTSYRLSPNVEPLCVLLYNGDGKTLEDVFPFGVHDYTVKRMRFRALVHGASQRADYSRFLVAPKVNARLAFNRVIERLVHDGGVRLNAKHSVVNVNS